MEFCEKLRMTRKPAISRLFNARKKLRSACFAATDRSYETPYTPVGAVIGRESVLRVAIESSLFMITGCSYRS